MSQLGRITWAICSVKACRHPDVRRALIRPTGGRSDQVLKATATPADLPGIAEHPLLVWCGRPASEATHLGSQHARDAALSRPDARLLRQTLVCRALISSFSRLHRVSFCMLTCLMAYSPN